MWHGGAVQASLLVGYLNLPVLIMEKQMQRSIGHYFDHGLRPVAVCKDTGPDGTMYLTADRLSPKALTKPVLYKSSFSHTGQGTKIMGLEELDLVFGLSSLQCLSLT